MPALLELQNVSKIFHDNEGQERPALLDINFEVQEQEFICLVGPSGCGKSTLINLISGLDTASSGHIRIQGQEVTKPGADRGIVFQKYFTFPWLTVQQNVEFGLKIAGMPRVEREKVAREHINIVGLSGYEQAFPRSLSGGMQQRVAIASVLAANPRILLMDEPFSALDAQTKELMQEFLTSLWEENKKTVLFVTHDIEEAIFLADKVFVMSSKPGQLKEMVPVNLERPRTHTVKLSTDFLRIKKHIAFVIRSEAMKAAHVSLDLIHPHALKVGLQIWPGVMPLYLASEVELFNAHGLETELVGLEKKEQGDRHESLHNGEVDVLHLTTDSVVRAWDEGLPVEIIACLSQSNGADALVVHSEINTVAELKGKTIAVENNWVSEFFLLHILKKHGLKRNDVELRYFRTSDTGSQLINNQVDAAVMQEPWLSQLLHLNVGKVLVSSAAEPVIFDVLVATPETCQKKAEQLQSLIKAWFEALDYARQNSSRALRIMTIPLGLSTRELQRYLESIQLLDHSSNHQLLGTNATPGSLALILESISAVLRENDEIAKVFPGAKMVNNHFVQ